VCRAGKGDDRRTRELNGYLARVSRTFADTTQRHHGGAFRLFRDEQRAVGEVMLEPVDGEPRRYQCIGYAAFATRLETDPGFARWFQRLSDEAVTLADPAPGQLDRLIDVQHALIDVIRFLDPDGVRFPGVPLAPVLPPPGAAEAAEPQGTSNQAANT
jgi:hypothetical protein